MYTGQDTEHSARPILLIGHLQLAISHRNPHWGSGHLSALGELTRQLQRLPRMLWQRWLYEAIPLLWQ